MDNSEKDAVIRRLIEIVNLPSRIECLKSDLAKNLATFGDTKGNGNEITGEGTVRNISKLKEELLRLDKDLELTQDIRLFFNSH